MTEPIDLLFGGMGQLGPGSDADTRHVLQLLPARDVRIVVDAGCGTGRQTLVLAKQLGVPIQALDTHPPFLDELARRARDAGLAHLIETRCLDMRDIPRVFRDIDLLWSEGAAYNIGFAAALAIWAPSLAGDACVVVSELSWLGTPAPQPARELFQSVYPAMQSVDENLAAASQAGYRALATHTLPARAWVEGYYDELAPRAVRLLEHPEARVRELAEETLREIAVFERSEDSYGYVFYVLKRR